MSKTAKEPKLPRMLVVLDTQIKLHRKDAARFVESGTLYVDDCGESTPKKPHLHINPDFKIGLVELERIIKAVARARR